MARKSRKTDQTTTVDQKTEIKVYQTAIYVRLSVTDNSKDTEVPNCISNGKAIGISNGSAIENQIAYLEYYRKLTSDLQLVGIYNDNGYSGSNFLRPEWKRLMEDVKKGLVNCILVKDLSRLGRDYIEVGDYLEHIFPLLKVRFISVNDYYDSSSPSAANEGFTIAFKNMIHTFYAKEISKKVTLSLHMKQRRGEYQGAHPPYGYLYKEGNPGRLVVDKVTAPVVKQIFLWAREGYSNRAIIKFLNDKGIPSPRSYFYQLGYFHSEKYATDNPWVVGTIKRIKENQIYLGNMVRRKTEQCLYKNISKRHIPETEWIIVYNTQEAIICRELFQEVSEKKDQ